MLRSRAFAGGATARPSALWSTAFVLAGLAAACSAAPEGEHTGRTAAAITYSALPPTNVTAFGAADLENAYNVPTFLAANTTVAIIMGGGDDPNAEEDLAVYRAAYGLPTCTASTGCFLKLTSAGGTALPVASNNSGAGELMSTALDMASAGCPSCKLLVVELTGGDPSELLTAVNTAKAHGASAMVSLASWTAIWDTLPADDGALAQEGVTVFASPGQIFLPAQTGTGTTTLPLEYPAESPNVISVGQTNLTLPRAVEASVSEFAASTGVSICSSKPKPSWQTDTGCGGRTVNDVSALNGPVWTFNTFQANDVWQLSAGGWMVQGQSAQDNHEDAIGGVIASSLVAAIFAQTGNGSAGPSYPYAHPGYFNDVSSGNVVQNGSTCAGYMCNAGVGYDGPTGLGTPDGMDMALINRLWLDADEATVDLENPYLGDQGTGTIVVEPGQVALPWYGVETNTTWASYGGLAVSFSGLPAGVSITNLGGTGSATEPGANYQIVAGSNATIGQQSTLTIAATSNGQTHYLQYEVLVQTCVPTATLASCTADECGRNIPDGCGGAVACPVIPRTCAQLGAQCGEVTNCAEEINCGSCTGTNQCTGNTCCPPGEVGGEGVCCPAGDSVSVGHCCPAGKAWLGNECVTPIHLPPPPIPRCGKLAC
jgi:hypothetical protein